MIPAESVIDVVVRCRNEMPYAQATLEGLARQRAPRACVLFIDCRSADGSREKAIQAGCEMIDLEPQAYLPGRVLNLGMERTRSEIVAFVNADAIPLHDDALARLIAPLRDSDVAATFGRQLARPDADRLTKLDYERAFGSATTVETRYGLFFSMAGSAIRRDVWERLRFDEELRYSEDVDWTYRVRALGYQVIYVPEARFEHSHSYDLQAHFRRRRGEGKADAAIFRLREPAVVGDFLQPLAGSLLRGLRAGLVSPHCLATRLAQAAGYFVGRREAVRGS